MCSWDWVYNRRRMEFVFGFFLGGGGCLQKSGVAIVMISTQIQVITEKYI